MDWAVVTVPRSPFGGTLCEDRAAADLRGIGLKSYVPKLLRTVVRRGKGKVEHIEPLFARYLFAELDDRWPKILRTPHVSGLLMSGEQPAHVPDEVIAELKQREGPNGLIPVATAKRPTAAGDHLGGRCAVSAHRR